MTSGNLFDRFASTYGGVYLRIYVKSVYCLVFLIVCPPVGVFVYWSSFSGVKITIIFTLSLRVSPLQVRLL